MKKYLKYIIAFMVCLAISVIIMFSKDIFKQESSTDIMHILCDAFFVPGILMLGFGLLVVASNGGTFDMLIYGTKKFFNLFRRNTSKKLHDTFYDYRKAKSENKLEFLYMIIIGLIFLAVSMVFLLLYYEL